MSEQVVKIQAVINTLETMQMTTTFDNVNKMLGIFRTLAEVRDALGTEVEDGDAEAE